MPRKPQRILKSKPAPRKTGRREHSLSNRVLGTCLVEIEGNSLRAAARKVNIPSNTLSDIRKRAVEHAKENELPIMDPSNYENAPRSGRPTTLSISEADQLCSYVVSSRENRDKSIEQHIRELDINISVSTFKQVLYDRGYARRLHGWKTKLDGSHQKKRLKFARTRRTFNWKRRIIVTDEVSIKKAERNEKARCWRLAGEEFDRDVIEKKGPSDDYADGMMWGSFAWGKKGPIHFFSKETAEEKVANQRLLDLENAEEQGRHWIAFESIQMIKDAELASTGKRRKGPYPKYQAFLNKHIKQRGDRSKGGVDWLLHRELVLKPKLLPFAKELMEEGREPVVLEDGASSHDNKHNHDLFEQWGIEKMRDHPPRSPDINAIEHAWDWCRKYIADHRYVPHSREENEAIWREAWEALPMEKINKWIEDISDTLEKIIAADGDNDFHG